MKLNEVIEANKFIFNCIPFTKVKAIEYSSKNPMNIRYKKRFIDDASIACEIKPSVLLRNPQQQICLRMPQNSAEAPKLSKEKIKDITSMLNFMPLLGRQYMKTLISTRSKTES